jgi:hypothetical protein
MYEKIPFGLINARETFQRAMDIKFVGERTDSLSYTWMI